VHPRKTVAPGTPPRPAAHANRESRWLIEDPNTLARVIAAALGSRRDLKKVITAALFELKTPQGLATFLVLEGLNHTALVAALQRGTYGRRLDAALRSSPLVQGAHQMQALLLRDLQRRQAPLDRGEIDDRGAAKSPNSAEDFTLGFSIAVNTTAGQLCGGLDGGPPTAPETAFLRQARNFLTPPQRRPTKKGHAPAPWVRKAGFLRLVLDEVREHTEARRPARHVLLGNAKIATFMEDHFIGKSCAHRWLNELDYPRSPRGNPDRGADGKFSAGPTHSDSFSGKLSGASAG